jgi:hypothetical protein
MEAGVSTQSQAESACPGLNRQPPKSKPTNKRRRSAIEEQQELSKERQHKTAIEQVDADLLAQIAAVNTPIIEPCLNNLKVFVLDTDRLICGAGAITNVGVNFSIESRAAVLFWPPSTSTLVP